MTIMIKKIKNCFLVTLMLWGCRQGFSPFGSRESSSSPRALDSNQGIDETSHLPVESIRKIKKTLDKVAQDISKNYPSDHYHYVFIGRSPAPLLALIGPGKTIHTVPFSEARSIPLTTFDIQYNCEGTFWLKKMFDHFDLYLGRLLQQLKNQSGPKKVVVIDYGFMGESVGIFLKFLNLYFRYHAHLSGVQSPIPSTEYFVMNDFDIDFNMERMKERIAEWNTPIQEAFLERIVVKVVSPGQIFGQKKVTINPRQWTQALNKSSLSANSTDPWRGTIYPLKDQELIKAFNNQVFDRYSPYGSWSLEKSPLETSSPAYRPEFWQLRQMFQASAALE